LGNFRKIKQQAFFAVKIKTSKSIIMIKPGYLVAIMLLVCLSANAQITGLWVVKEVNVGDEVMTPVAKWFQLNEDKSSQSGNGLLQNSGGTYIVTPDYSVLIFTDQYGKTDEYGAFQVSLIKDEMTWDRVEEGQAVKVKLQKADKKPVGPWDQVIGNWKLVESTMHDKISNQQIFMRWDREYRASNLLFDENTSGIWHIAGHRPHLKLLSFNKEIPYLDFTISFFQDYRMIWTQEDGNAKLVFDRSLE